MSKLSITIMAHPDRKDYIPYLKDKLGDVLVVWDEKNNLWDTCRRAWLAQDMSAEYGLVVQDDAIVCDGFREKAEAMLNEDYIYSFFAGYMLESRIRLAEKNGEDHVLTGVIFNEVALCMRTEHIRSMVKFSDDRDARHDQFISQWAKFNKIKVYHPIPSLIDHRDDDSIYQRVYKRPAFPTKRKACRYIEK